eukprot:SAG11_NODE_451_length_9386_cov_42.557661_2_plen_57_part_00
MMWKEEMLVRDFHCRCVLEMPGSPDPCGAAVTIVTQLHAPSFGPPSKALGLRQPLR